jgi:hypothetical protein
MNNNTKNGGGAMTLTTYRLWNADGSYVAVRIPYKNPTLRTVLRYLAHEVNHPGSLSKPITKDGHD